MMIGIQDYKNSILKKMTGDDKIDPGTFSIGETGWWVLHATVIAGIYVLGSRMARQD